MDALPQTLTTSADVSNWAGLALLLVLAWLISRITAKRGWRRRWRWPTNTAQPDVADPVQQLAFVSRVSFERQPLLNKVEFQVLLVLESVVRELRAGHRVMAQTSLGEILRPKPNAFRTADTDLAYRSINSKRADFVIVDKYGLAVLVVEYQGSGHYQGTARLRDAVKREAFRSAGIKLLEVTARFDRGQLARQVGAQLNPAPKTTLETRPVYTSK